MLTSNTSPFKSEIGLYPSRIFFVFSIHVRTMVFHHVGFQIDRRIKDDKFTSKTVRLSARVVGSIEVIFLDRYSGMDIRFLDEKNPPMIRNSKSCERDSQRAFQTKILKDPLLVNKPIPFANKTFFVPLSKMCVQFISFEETFSTKFAKWMDTTFDTCF